MKISISACLLWVFTASAFSADAPSDKDRIVTLAVDFCGGLVGEAPDAPRATSAPIAGLNLSAAKPLKEWTQDDQARAGIRAGLANQLDDPMRFAAFSDSPSIDSKLGAMFTADGSACSASGTSDGDAFAAIASRLDADKRWTSTERTEKPRTATWHRKTDSGGDVVFMLFNEATLTFNRVTAKFPPTTAASIRPLLKAVADQCVHGVLNGIEMEVGNFPQFYAYRRVDDVGHVAQLRTYSAFPLAILNASSFRKEFDCELSIGAVDTPAQELRAVMVEVVGAFEGASRNSDDQWRIKQPGKKRTAQVTTEIDPRGLVLLRIKTLGGHS